MAARCKNPNKVALRMGKQINFRPAAWMREALERHAMVLSEVVGRTVNVSAAIRDILARFFMGNTRDAGYESGFREGWACGYAEQQKRRYATPAYDDGLPRSNQAGDPPDRDGESFS